MDNVVNIFGRNRSRDVASSQSTSQSVASKTEKRVNGPVVRGTEEADFRTTQSRQPAQSQTPTEPPKDFRALAAWNAANQDRLRKEREQANKNVLKSYRIK